MVIGSALILGLVSWLRIGVDLWPAVRFPTVVVTIAYPGASPEAIDALVVRPVEDALAVLSDVESIQSSSTEGLASVVVSFTDRTGAGSALLVERHVNA